MDSDIYTEWNRSLSTKIDRIDKQHQELFARINDLIRAINENRGEEEIFFTLNFLGNYINIHLQEEEYLQRRYNYPHYLSHKAIHDKFVEDFNLLKNGLNSGEVNNRFVYRVKQKMSDWLAEHINRVDKQMAEYLSEYMS